MGKYKIKYWLMMIAKEISIKKNQQAIVDVDKNRVVINSLDYDSLAKIFMLLPIPVRITMEEVCPKWKEACKLAWHDIKKYKCELTIGRSYDNCLLTHSYLKKVLLRCGIYLKELSLSSALNVSIMPVVGRNCKNLTRLECEFTEHSLDIHRQFFINAFTQLEKLKYLKMHIKSDDGYGTMNISEIIDSLPEEIDEIHLFPKAEIVYRYSSFTLKKFKNLQKLSLQGFYGDKLIQEIAEKITLVYLDIQVFNVPQILYSFNQLVNSEHMKISSYMKRAWTPSSTDLNAFSSTCHNLKYLDVPYVAEIPSENWINLKHLEHLGIDGSMTEDLAIQIVKYCKNLKYLRVDCIIETQTALRKLTELENLESLLLLGLKFFTFSFSVPLITALSKNCKKLKRLAIPNYKIEESTELRLLSASVLDDLSKLQYLEHLNLSFVTNLKDSTILAIANNCKELKFLNIEGCINITATALMALTSLKNLQELNVNLIDLTDSVIVKLKGLNRLDCVGCMNLTENGIITFIKNNPDLENLDIRLINYMDIIDAVNEATKNRTNGIILKIRTIDDDLIEESKCFITSKWVVFRSNSKQIEIYQDNRVLF